MLIRALLVVIAMSGVAEAGGPPSWCKGPPKDRDDAWAGTAENSLQDYRSSHHSQYRLLEAARLTCNAPRDPAAAKIGDEVLHAWMKESGLSEAEANNSLAARIDGEAWKTELEKLCEPLEEAGFEKIPRAHKFLFGCNGEQLWLMPGNDMSDMAEMVDRGAVSHDDLAHLAWMISRATKALDPTEKHAIAGYIIDQVDFRVLPTDAAMLHALDEEPYKGSRVAKVILIETMAYLRMVVARVEAAVAKKTQDPKWKEILVTAPGRGIAAWDEAATKLREQLAHSDEKQKPGCEKVLRADLLPILKKLEHKDLPTFLGAVSDHPLAGLFIQRLGLCMVKQEKQQAAGQLIYDLAEYVRIMPGPRMAAYYATLDAVGKLGEDSPLKPGEIPKLGEPKYGHAEFDNRGTHGVIASVAKKGGSLHVVFVTTKIQELARDCVETNKIDRVNPDGKVEYRKVCHDAGLVWVDTTPMPVDVPIAYGDSVKAGRKAAFDDAMGAKNAIPVAIYNDKQGHKLVNVATFPLE